MPSRNSQTAARVGVPLSPREKQLLALWAEGMSNKQVALWLGISCQTVKNCAWHMYVKLGVHNRTRAMFVGWRAGIVR